MRQGRPASASACPRLLLARDGHSAAIDRFSLQVTESISCDVTHCCTTADQPTPICRSGGVPDVPLDDATGFPHVLGVRDLRIVGEMWTGGEDGGGVGERRW
jgi:hypothetical protein